MKTICPVCCSPAQVRADGTITKHDDGVGSTCVMTGRQAPPWTERSTREAVSSRSGGICEYCCRYRGQEKHHRKSRGIGGVWCPNNILDLCSKCHAEVTGHPTWAKTMGLRVVRGDDPEMIPVIRVDGSYFQPTNLVTPPQLPERKLRDA